MPQHQRAIQCNKILYQEIILCILHSAANKYIKTSTILTWQIRARSPKGSEPPFARSYIPIQAIQDSCFSESTLRYARIKIQRYDREWIWFLSMNQNIQNWRGFANIKGTRLRNEICFAHLYFTQNLKCQLNKDEH